MSQYLVSLIGDVDRESAIRQMQSAGGDDAANSLRQWDPSVSMGKREVGAGFGATPDEAMEAAWAEKASGVKTEGEEQPALSFMCMDPTQQLMAANALDPNLTSRPTLNADGTLSDGQQLP